MKILTLLLFFSTQLFAEDLPNHYSLKVIDAAHHLAEVQIKFNAVNDKTFEVKLPVWRSGRYEILDLSKNIRYFSATDSKNKPLNWHKTNKNSWNIALEKPGSVIIKYQVYANELKKRVSHIDQTHAFIDASGVFMFNQSQRGKALTVKLDVAESWQSRSGLPSIGDHHFIATDYDQLVDSPIESGLHQFDSIQVDEQTYEIVIWGKGNHDMQQIKQDVVKLHHQAKHIWKTFPFKRYLYIIHAGDKLRGATEHVNSTIIQTDRFNFKPAEKYQKFITTTSHEFVHTWNVKAYRPAGITPYNYDSENYSSLFWLVEGATSYYADLLAVRGDVYKPEVMFEALAKDISKYLNKPGRNVMSLEESSFDKWLQQDNNRKHNASVNIYLKGALVSWLLDTEIRKLSNNKKSMDDLHYLLYQNHNNKDKGYSESDVLGLLNSLTKHDFKPFWENYISGTKSIDFDALLAFYGLQFGEPDDKAKSEEKSWLGINITNNQALAEIKTVSFQSPAWQAGLTAGDQIIAIDNFKVNSKNLLDRIEGLDINQPVPLHYFNNGSLKQTTVQAIKEPTGKLKIVPVDKPSKKQKQNFKSWLKKDFKNTFL